MQCRKYVKTLIDNVHTTFYNEFTFYTKGKE